VSVPWRENSPVSERKQFIRACTDRRRKIADICREFGISEKTGYKILRRYRESGDAGLEDRSHAVLEHPFRISEEVQQQVFALKRAYPHYGPQTIHDRLVQHEPLKHWPAASSIGELLKRNGLVHRRRRGDHDREGAELNSHLTKASTPNLVWTADFKGQFRLNTGFGSYCYPLTVMDLSSRFVLGLRALQSVSVEPTRREFTRIFREYGLPGVIRTDNGVPFAQPNAIGRLGQLALWWVRLGIKPEHIRPGRPSENGSHERFHKTLKAAATKPASPSFASQQKRFDLFRGEYNDHRPHRSLKNRRPPGTFYTSSLRVYPEKLPPLIYPERAMMRIVTTGGAIKWQNEQIFISSNIVGDYVGIIEEADDTFSVNYGNLEVGRIDAETRNFTAGVRWKDPL
jgi:putative transposase